jgi:hypothetical protein
MKNISLLTAALTVLLTLTATAQLTGIKNIPGDYPTLDAAITDLNTQGVGAGGVTLNLLAGNPQTAPVGGYVLGGAGSLVLTSSSASNPVLIVGNGNTITANAGLVAGSVTDAIFKLVGADWLTLSGFIMQENPANTITTPASNNMTEWGVALLHVSTADGAQNNTIQNNTISLNRGYANSFGIYCNNRHSATSATVTEDIVNNTTGPNNGNKIYGNTISNVNLGIALVGSSTAANMDAGNDVGGSAAGTGNTISDWGGAAPASSFISVSGTSFCILMNHQTAENVSFNTLTSATVSGTSVTFRGILKDYTAGAPSGTFTSTINNNIITMSSGFTSGTFEAIRSQGMTALATATININSNSVLNCVVSGASSSSAIVGIVNSSAPGVLTMNNNTVRGNTSTATTGGFTGLSNSGAVVNSINMDGNHVGDATAGAITFSAATSGTVTGIGNSGGAATAALSMRSNDIRGIVHSVAGTSTHSYLSSTAATLSQNISGNTFTALNVATTGSVTFMADSVTAPAGGSKTISSNSIVTSFTKSGAGGTVTLYSDNASSVAGVVVNNTDNNFSNISVTGATTIAGWSNTDGGQPTKTIARNTFANWTGGTSAMTVMNINFGSTSSTTVVSNNISNISGGGAVTGIVLGSSIGTLSASSNRINTLASTGASAVQGMTSASTSSSLFKNKIYDLLANNAAGTVNGVTVSGGTTVTLYDNLLGDLRAPATSSTSDAIRGINLTSTTSSSSINVYYNTVYINASSSGANFGTSGLFHTASATATTAKLDLRNNVIVNTSTPNGTGLTVAYRRSTGGAGTLANYASTANNNDFYAGAPSAANLIYSDGTSTAQTLSDYKSGVFTAGTIAPRDSASVGENPSFLSITGSSPNFLHIDPATATALESGAVPVGGIVDDFDGDTRNAGTPDIGADEFNGTPLDTVPPVISYTLLGNDLPAANRALPGFATITDNSGTVAGGANAPRFYFKKSTDADVFGVPNNSTGNGWKYVVTSSGSSPYSFNVDYSLLTGGGVTAGDVIQYFVVAQDPSNFLGSNPSGAGASGNPPVQNVNAHGAVNSYLIAQAFGGTKTVAPSGADYPSLSNPGGMFEAINNGVVTGNLVILITGDLTGETGAVALNQTAESGPGNYTITVRPSGGPRIISGSSAASLIRLNDADRVTIDGSTTGATAPPGVGGVAALREMTINNLNTGTAAAVLTASGVANGSQNNTFRNLNIVGADPTTTLVGISLGGATANTFGLHNDSNRVENCSVQKAIFGIYSAGNSAAVPNLGTVILRNDLSATAASRIRRVGIVLFNDNGAQITENSVGGIDSNESGGDAFGITLGTTAVSTTTTTGGGVINANVRQNKINGVSQTVTYSAVGIAVAGGAGVNTIANNMISGVIANATAGDLPAGILVLGATGSTNRLYFNSVAMTGNRGTTTSQYPSYGVAITGTDPAVELKDNIFYTTQDPGSGGSSAKSYAIGTASTTFANLAADYNAFYSAGPVPGYFRSGSLSTAAGTDYANLAAWRAAVAQDANSIEADPLFTSDTDLHISGASPAWHAGVTIPGISIDIDGETRAATPSIGADEPSGIGVSYTLLANTLPAANRPLPNFATVVSLGAPVSGGANAPRFYFKKSTDADVFGVANDSTGNGWKYVVTSSGSSPYSFTVDYSLLTGGGVTGGDVIQYFVVAQDDSNLLGSSPYGAGASGNPPVQNINAHGAVNSFFILTALSGTRTVAPSGADYPSLSNPGGMFEAINNGVVTGDLVILITGDLTAETGAVALNQTAEAGPGNYTIAIRPSGAPRMISGSSAASLIRLNDADRVTIDGSTTGATAPPGVGGVAALREMTINNLNTGTAAAVLTASGVANGAQNNTFRNLNIIGADPTTTLVGISLGGATAGTVGLDNDNNRIENCSVQKAIYGIYSAGINATNANLGTVIIRNDLSATGADRIRRVGILLFNEDGAQITENSVGGIDTTESVDAIGIGLGTQSISTTIVTGGGVVNADVIRNKVNGVSSSATAGFSAVGVAVAGGAGVNKVEDNMISGVIANATSPDLVAGIFAVGAPGSATHLYFNSVAMTGNRGTTASQYPSYALAITGTDPAVELKDNIFYNTQEPGSGGANAKSYAIGTASTTFANMASDYNDFYSAGVFPGYFRSGSLNGGSGTDYPDLAAWSAAVAGDANSIEADPLFTSDTDLHITNSSPAWHAGVTIAGIVRDIDGDLRPATPSIGADEPPAPAMAVSFTLTSAVILGDGSFQFGFTNISGVSFTAFASTNVDAPFITWLNVGPAVETPAGSGQYLFTDPQATNAPQRFYRVRSP